MTNSKPTASPDSAAPKEITEEIEKAVYELQCANGDGLVLLGKWKGGRVDEEILHARFAAYRKQGEWFHAAPEIIEWASSQSLNTVPSATPPEAA